MSTAVVIDADGLTFGATLEPGPVAEQVTLRLDDGAQFLVPNELLVQRADGRYDLGMRLSDYATQQLETSLQVNQETGLDPAMSLEPASEKPALETDTGGAITHEATAETPETGDVVIPLVAETLEVGKRTVARAKVQLHKYVTECTETASMPLTQEHVEIERISVNRPVEEAEPVRFDGDTMIVPRYEEVLVVSKQLMLVEEVRVTTRRTERQETQQVTLRREELEIDRLAAERPDDESAGNE